MTPSPFSSYQLCLPGVNPLFRSGCDWGSILVAREEGHKRAGGGPANWPRGTHHPLTENFLSLPWALLLICYWYLYCANSLLPRLERGATWRRRTTVRRGGCRRCLATEGCLPQETGGILECLFLKASCSLSEPLGLTRAETAALWKDACV